MGAQGGTSEAESRSPPPRHNEGSLYPGSADSNEMVAASGRSSETPYHVSSRAVSSAGERFVHTEEAGSSILPPPTTNFPAQRFGVRNGRLVHYVTSLSSSNSCSRISPPQAQSGGPSEALPCCWQRTPPLWDSGVTAARDPRYRSSPFRDWTGAFRFSPRLPPSACLGIAPNWLAQPPSHRIRLWGGFLTLSSFGCTLMSVRSARPGSG
jgi:hypothetical protein